MDSFDSFLFVKMNGKQGVKKALKEKKYAENNHHNNYFKDIFKYKCLR